MSTRVVYHYDGLGSTRALSNLSAVVTDRYAYTAFGETDPAGASGNSSGATKNSYLYTGEQNDANLGFYYLRARYMDPSRGSFVSQDNFQGIDGSTTSANKYLYANAGPTWSIDPSGYFTCSTIPKEAKGSGSQQLGYQIEIEVAKEYCGTFAGNNVEFGNNQYYGEVVESSIGSGDYAFKAYRILKTGHI